MRQTQYHIVISGRVQGVFFRESMRREATRLGLVGWVRNLSDGRVEAVIEGTKSALESLVSWARQGPDAAQVENIQKRAGPPTGDFREFRILH